MKKCNNCDVEMIENTDLHTDFVGGVSFEEQIYLDFVNGTTISKSLFGKEKETDKKFIRRVKARVCPNCGKVELYINLNEEE